MIPKKTKILWGCAYLPVFIFAFFLSGVFAPSLNDIDPVDPSWQAVIELAVSRNLQWGKDIIFTYGPLGFLNGTYSQGLLITARVLFALIWGGISSWVIIGIIRNISSAWRYFLLLWFLLGTTLFYFNLQNSAYIAITWFALLLIGRNRNPIVTAAATAIFAVLALVKFTFFLAAVTSLFICVMVLTMQRKYKNVVLILSGFFGSFIFLWLVLGQKLGNLLPWLKGSWELTAGYSEAMAIFPSIEMLIASLVAGGGLLTLFLLVAVSRQFSPAHAGFLAITFLSAVLVWKQGLVRADVIHLHTYFFNLPLLAGILVSEEVTGNFSKRRKFLCTSLFATVLCTCILSSELAMTGVLQKMVVAFPKALIWKTDMLLKIASGKNRDCFQSLASGYNKSQNIELPGIKAVAGASTVDEQNISQWAVIANGMNYTPRPVIQAYSAYTPYLQQLDLSFFESRFHPDYLLLNMHTIDNRYPPLDDALIFPIILGNYKPEVQEKGFILLKADENNHTFPRFELLDERTITYDVPFEFSGWNDRLLLLKVEIEPTLLGKLAGLFFQRPKLDMVILGEEGYCQNSFSPTMGKNGFVINPFLGMNDDVARYYDGEWKRNIGVKFIAPKKVGWLYSKEVKVKLFKIIL